MRQTYHTLYDTFDACSISKGANVNYVACFYDYKLELQMIKPNLQSKYLSTLIRAIGA